MRFQLLARAKELVALSTTFQEFDESLITIRRKKFKRIEEESTMVRYWGLVAIMQTFRIKVIVRQIGHGQKHFWSVIPAWVTTHYRDIKLISNARGDLRED